LDPESLRCSENEFWQKTATIFRFPERRTNGGQVRRRQRVKRLTGGHGKRAEAKLSHNTAMLRCSKMLKSTHKNKDSSENQHE
jgi:hypothetical protein